MEGLFDLGKISNVLPYYGDFEDAGLLMLRLCTRSRKTFTEFSEGIHRILASPRQLISFPDLDEPHLALFKETNYLKFFKVKLTITSTYQL